MLLSATRLLRQDSTVSFRKGILWALLHGLTHERAECFRRWRSSSVPISQKLKKSWWFRPLLLERESDAASEKKSSSSKLLVLCGLLAIVLQTTLLPYLWVIPDLLLIFCVYLAM